METARVVTFKIEFEPGEALLQKTHWFGRTQSNDQAEVVALEYSASVHPGNNNRGLVEYNGFSGTVRSLRDSAAVERVTLTNGDLAPEVLTAVREELAKRMDEHMGHLVRG